MPNVSRWSRLLRISMPLLGFNPLACTFVASMSVTRTTIRSISAFMSDLAMPQSGRELVSGENFCRPKAISGGSSK